MKIKKSQIGNLISLVLIAVLLFTPVGMYVSVFITRLISTSPTVKVEAEREQLIDFNWNLETTEGSSIVFSSLKEKVILINFWATWCPPCIAEMPSLQNLYDDYKEDVVFLFVSNEEATVIEKFMVKHQYNFPVFNMFSEVPEQLKSASIPATYLISKKGVIIIDKKGAAKWDSKKIRQTIDELLSE